MVSYLILSIIAGTSILFVVACIVLVVLFFYFVVLMSFLYRGYLYGYRGKLEIYLELVTRPKIKILTLLPNITLSFNKTN